jgi:hypothetical protein
MLSSAAKMGEGERRADDWAQRAPRPRALAQSLYCCEALKQGEGGVSGACAPRRMPMVRTRRAARHGAARRRNVHKSQDAEMDVGTAASNGCWWSECWRVVEVAKRSGGRPGGFCSK